jgi:hypothetical protein
MTWPTIDTVATAIAGVRQIGTLGSSFDTNFQTEDKYDKPITLESGLLLSLVSGVAKTASSLSSDMITENYRVLPKFFYSDAFPGIGYMNKMDKSLMGVYDTSTLVGVNVTEIDTTDISFSVGLNMGYSVVIPSGPSLYTFWS